VDAEHRDAVTQPAERPRNLGHDFVELAGLGVLAVGMSEDRDPHGGTVTGWRSRRDY
jgi:hypothetical protein